MGTVGANAESGLTHPTYCGFSTGLCFTSLPTLLETLVVVVAFERAGGILDLVSWLFGSVRPSLREVRCAQFRLHRKGQLAGLFPRRHYLIRITGLSSVAGSIGNRHKHGTRNVITPAFLPHWIQEVQIA